MKIYRVVRWAMSAALLLTVFLLLKSPAPVARPLDPGRLQREADSFQEKINQLARPQSSDDAEVRFTVNEVNAALEQSAAPQPAQPTSVSQSGPPAPAIPIKSTQVSFQNDVVKGQFLTEVYGKDVYITVAGHLGSRDGYATFEPTEFKVGDLSVPVSLVNPALQRKLAEPENRDKLKLPEFVKGLRVENSELVITR